MAETVSIINLIFILIILFIIVGIIIFVVVMKRRYSSVFDGFTRSGHKGPIVSSPSTNLSTDYTSFKGIAPHKP
jgi:hypothetical protein